MRWLYSLTERIKEMMISSGRDTREADQARPDKTMTNLCHGVNLNQCTAKRKITTIKQQDSCEGEDLDDIYPRVRQFLDWRKESHDIDIRLEALLQAR